MSDTFGLPEACVLWGQEHFVCAHLPSDCTIKSWRVAFHPLENAVTSTLKDTESQLQPQDLWLPTFQWVAEVTALLPSSENCFSL